ncbi:MAG TPA: hypothetical protein VFA43_26665 [Gemmatimonadaceae bacterium]|nr:hypothetical protein [Gemmatimonadaceae bacterium]
MSARYIVCVYDPIAGATLSFDTSPSFFNRETAFAWAAANQDLADGEGIELCVRDLKTGNWWRLRREPLH